MKTISLTDRAYDRLASWKRGHKDSFSRVVDRVVPARGTLGSISKAAKTLPVLTERQLEAVEQGMKDLKKWADQRDPWTM